MSLARPARRTAVKAPPPSTRPEWANAQLFETLKYLALPVTVYVLATLLQADVPSIVTYALFATHIPWMLMRLKSNPELVMATTILYIPLCRLYVLPLAPGLNGTNMLLICLLYAWKHSASTNGEPFFRKLPLTPQMKLWGILSFTSFATSIYTFGFASFMEIRAGQMKLWADQFLLFFAFINLTRNGAMARRVAIYLLIGAAVVGISGLAEWWVKRDARSIEAGRLLGPQGQPNDLAGFLAYSSGPFVALFFLNFKRPLGWAAGVYLAIVARVLIASASRGGYIGFGVEVLIVMLLRGKAFLLSWILAAALAVAIFPQLIPNTLVARLNETKAEPGQQVAAAGPENLDKSSQTRLILWKAALDMTLESPLLGKGYKTFPYLKSQYTEIEVHESDNHNMYLWIASQMGIPALLSIIYLVWRLHRLSRGVYEGLSDNWGKSIGLGIAGMCGAVAAVNMFGSRLVDAFVMAYIWMYAALIPHLWLEANPPAPPAPPRGPKALRPTRPPRP